MASKHCYNQVVLFGDSITEFSFDPELHGYGTLLANAYVRRMDVLNRGFSGYNTDWALPILRQLLPTTKEQQVENSSIPLMTIFFGANDATFPFSRQHVPIERYESNVREMIGLIKDPQSRFYNPKLRLILITPPPIHEEQWTKHCEAKGEKLDRSNENARVYAECVVKIGKELDVPVADIWSCLMNKANGDPNVVKEYLLDGLHLNANGYKELYDILMSIISEKYYEIHPENLKYELAYWKDVAEKNASLEFPLLK